MDFVKSYKVVENEDGHSYTIVFYLDQNYTEFADEFSTMNSKQAGRTVNEFVKSRFPEKKFTKVKFFAGSLLVMSFMLGANPASAESTDSAARVVQSEQIHVVKVGETLSHLAKYYNVTVDQIKNHNQLSSDIIFVGQPIKVPQTTGNTQSLVTYEVKSGDTLSGLAKRYDTTAQNIKQANNLTSDVIYIGQKISIPTQAQTQNNTTQSETTNYTVQSGDSLSVIAKKFNTTITQLKNVNNLKSDTIYVGQTLQVQSNNTAAETPIQQTTPSNYIVQSGDSLSVIAKKYNTTVQQIKNANQLTTDTIYVGQSLSIPSGQAQTGTTVDYEVKSGDTLSEIANQYNVSVQSIISANNLTSTTIYIGQKLLIPNASETPQTYDGELREGVQSDQVRAIQNNLRTLGYFNAQSTGYYGNVTSQAVTNFQRDYGLADTGVVDQQTQGMIDRAIVKNRLVNDLSTYTGVPYVWGGSSPSGFDCSGFVYFMFNKHGVNIDRTTSSGFYNMGENISRADLQPGDLVYFSINNTGTVSHVGFYTGNNSFVSATSSKGIWEYSMDNSYWSKHYVGANRIF